MRRLFVRRLSYAPCPAGGRFGIGVALTLGCIAATAIADPLGAQDEEPFPSAKLVGQVVSETTGAGIEGAVISLRHSRQGALTDADGNFQIVDARPGIDTVEVSYLGYEPGRVEIELKPGHTTRTVLLLGRTVLRLAEIRVTVERDRPSHLRQFDRRKHSGFGFFLTPEDIEKRKPQLASDAFRNIPGVHVGPVRFGRADVLISRSAKVCRPAIFLDGVYMPRMQVDDVPVTDLGFVEVYRGATEIPAQYATTTNSETCGVIAIWTPEGGPAGE